MPINTSMNHWSRIASSMNIETLSLNHRIGTSNQTAAGNPQFGEKVTGTEQSNKPNLPRPSGDTFSESG